MVRVDPIFCILKKPITEFEICNYEMRLILGGAAWALVCYLKITISLKIWEF